MKTINNDAVFFDFYYKYHKSIRIITTAAIAASQSDEYRIQEARGRLHIAENRKQQATMRQTENSAVISLAELQEEAQQAIQALSKHRAGEFRRSLQLLLNGGTFSLDEEHILNQQFPDSNGMTIEGLLITIKTNLIGMLTRAIVQARQDRDDEGAISFKRWLRWNQQEFQKEIQYLLFIEDYFGTQETTRLTFDNLMEELKETIQVSVSGDVYADARQAMVIVEKSQLIFKPKTRKNELIFPNAVERLISLIDKIVALEVFPWFKISEEGENLRRWIALVFSDESLVAKYNITLLDPNQGSVWDNTHLGKSWKNLSAALLEDDILKDNTSSILTEKNAVRLAEETRTSLETFKYNLGRIKDALVESAFVRFLKNIKHAAKDYKKTGRAILNWCKSNPLKTGMIAISVVSLVFLTAIAPFSAPFIFAGIASATMAMSNATAIGLTVVGGASLTVTALSFTASAGQLIRVENEEYISRLESEVLEAEARADEAEEKGRHEKAVFNRNEAKGFSTELERLQAGDRVRDAEQRASYAKQLDLMAKEALSQARARQDERPKPNASTQTVAQYELHVAEDDIDSIIRSVDRQKNASSERMLELDSNQIRILGNIIERRALYSGTFFRTMPSHAQSAMASSSVLMSNEDERALTFPDEASLTSNSPLQAKPSGCLIC